MNWANYLLLALLFIELGCILAMHGKPREGKHSFGFSLIMTVFYITVLYFGGWFK